MKNENKFLFVILLLIFINSFSETGKNKQQDKSIIKKEKSIDKGPELDLLIGVTYIFSTNCNILFGINGFYNFGFISLGGEIKYIRGGDVKFEEISYTGYIPDRISAMVLFRLNLDIFRIGFGLGKIHDMDSDIKINWAFPQYKLSIGILSKKNPVFGFEISYYCTRLKGIVIGGWVDYNIILGLRF